MNITEALEAHAAEPETPETAPAAPAAPEAPAPAEAAPVEAPETEPEVPLPDLYSDAALGTKAGIAAARDDLRTKLREVDREKARFAVEHKARHRKVVARELAVKQERERLREEHTIYRNAVQQMRTGNPDQALNALGVMFGRDGLKVYEELTLAVAGKAPKAEVSPEIAELRKELAAMKAQKAKESDSALIARRTQQLVDLARAQPYAKV